MNIVFINGSAKFDVDAKSVEGEFEYEINSITPVSGYSLDIDDIPTDHEAMEQLIKESILEQLN